MIRTLILIIWIISLSFSAILTIGGKSSQFILLVSDQIGGFLLGFDKKIQKQRDICEEEGKDETPKTQISANTAKPNRFLNCYLYYNYLSVGKTYADVPPIANTLDSLYKKYTWRNPPVERLEEDRQRNLDKTGFEKIILFKNDYINLFQKVDLFLQSYTFNEDINLDDVKIDANDILLLKFRFSFLLDNSEDSVGEISLSPAAKTWIKRERDKGKQLELIDAFVLFIIVGAFGRLTYLLHNHFLSDKNKNKPNVYQYIFGPIFSMFLALGIYVLNLSINSFTTTSEIENLRPRSLIVFVFAAGMLSEETYQWIAEGLGQKVRGRNSRDLEKPTVKGGDIEVISGAKEENT